MPPGPGGVPRLRAGVVVELAPGRFLRLQVREVEGQLDIREEESADVGSFGASASTRGDGPRLVTLVLTGVVDVMDERHRPAWADDVRQQQMGPAPRAIEAEGR